MSSPAASKIAERTPPLDNQIARRSFTLPTRASSRPRTAPASANSADGVETLFTHTVSKIISFTTANSSRQSSLVGRPSASDVGPETPDGIPWRSFGEHTLAVGPLRIYRVTSSNVSFLSSGSLLHTIFPRSQCWCVDGKSIFVLRIRQDSYYRIELPYETEEQKEQVEKFKGVLSQVLLYEKTRSPFKQTAEAIGSAKAQERSRSPPRRKLKGTPKAKKWLFDGTWVPENGPRPSLLEGEAGVSPQYEEDRRASMTSDLDTPNGPRWRPHRGLSVSERAKYFQSLRSLTMPGLVRRTSVYPASFQLFKGHPDDIDTEQKRSKASPSGEADTPLSGTESFFSPLGTPAQNSPSPPYVDAEAGYEQNPWLEQLDRVGEESRGRGRDRHRRQVSQITVRASSTGSVPHTPTLDFHSSSAPSTPPLSPDSDNSIEPSLLDVPTPPEGIRLKRLTGASQRRAFSPMPHPQNLFCPPNIAPRQRFTAELVRRTLELLFGPPAHLVALMLRIAAKISQGAFGWNTYRVRHAGEKIPGTWESSEEGDWEEDDFGIPLRNLDGSGMRKKDRSWSSNEVD